MRTTAATAAIRARAIEDLRAGTSAAGERVGDILCAATYPATHPVGITRYDAPAAPHRPADGPLRRTLVARAKRTDRTEARRRYVPNRPPPDDRRAGEDAGRKRPTSRRARRPRPPAATAAARPSFSAAFRAAFRERPSRGRPLALPRVLTHWGFLGGHRRDGRRDGGVHPLDERASRRRSTSRSRPGAGRRSRRSNISYIVREPVRRPPPPLARSSSGSRPRARAGSAA